MYNEQEYPNQKLTHLCIGAGYAVYNRLKFGYQEKYYQRAYALELQKLELQYKKELKIAITYNGVHIGRYFLDFLVADMIVVELKVASDFHTKHIAQVLGYLRAKKLKVGLILLFTKNGLQIKRIVN